MRFTGLRPLAHGPGQTDVTLDDRGHIDLRNDCRVVDIRFVPGPAHMSIVVGFEVEDAPTKTFISVEFTRVSVSRIEPYLPKGIDPHYGYALLHGLDYWRTTDDGQDGFTISTTVFEAEFTAAEMRAAVHQPRA